MASGCEAVYIIRSVRLTTIKIPTCMCDSVYKLRSYNTAELIMLNYRVSVAVCAVVLLVLLSAVRCAERRVTWSVEGVSDYQG